MTLPLKTIDYYAVIQSADVLSAGETLCIETGETLCIESVSPLPDAPHAYDVRLAAPEPQAPPAQPCRHAATGAPAISRFAGPVVYDGQRDNIRAVAPEIPIAHHGVTMTETCACGAQRRTNVNGPHLERGPWYRPAPQVTRHYDLVADERVHAVFPNRRQARAAAAALAAPGPVRIVARCEVRPA